MESFNNLDERKPDIYLFIFVLTTLSLVGHGVSLDELPAHRILGFDTLLKGTTAVLFLQCYQHTFHLLSWLCVFQALNQGHSTLQDCATEKLMQLFLKFIDLFYFLQNLQLKSKFTGKVVFNVNAALLKEPFKETYVSSRDRLMRPAAETL